MHRGNKNRLHCNVKLYLLDLSEKHCTVIMVADVPLKIHTNV